MNSPLAGRWLIRKDSGSKRPSRKSGSVPVRTMSIGSEVSVLVLISLTVGAVFVPSALIVISWSPKLLLPDSSVAVQVMDERLLIG